MFQTTNQKRFATFFLTQWCSAASPRHVWVPKRVSFKSWNGRRRVLYKCVLMLATGFSGLVAAYFFCSKWKFIPRLRPVDINKQKVNGVQTSSSSRIQCETERQWDDIFFQKSFEECGKAMQSPQFFMEKIYPFLGGWCMIYGRWLVNGASPFTGPGSWVKKIRRFSEVQDHRSTTSHFSTLFGILFEHTNRHILHNHES